MSPDDKRLSPEAALWALEQVAKDEAERIEGLSEAELRAEMAEDGQAAWKPPSREELLERVKARAVAQGRAIAPAAEKGGDAGARGASVAALPVRARRRASWTVALVAAAVVAVVILAAATAPRIVAYYRERAAEELVGQPPPLGEMARWLRDEALGFCAQGAWKRCAEKLDEAKRLDPSGELEERVVKARGKIAEAAGQKGP
jgi:hypothetical protein